MPKLKKGKLISIKKLKKPLTKAKKPKQKDKSVEIFDSTVGSTESLFINTPKNNLCFFFYPFLVIQGVFFLGFFLFFLFKVGNFFIAKSQIFETPAPVITERDTNTGKQVTISAQNEDRQNPLTDILAFTIIPEIFKVGQESKIQVKWQNNGNQDVQFTAHDLNSNGMIDYIEWTVPHLSEQTFNIIFISKAFQLDENKNIITDIYNQVRSQDNNWSTIENGQYVRITFETKLTNQKDITLYAKPTDSSQPVRVEVYTENGAELITTFENIDQENTYKIYLTNLQNSTDVFDLKIIGASIDIDYIVDPTITWDGEGTDGTCGGAAGDGNKWSCAANWSSDTLPTSIDIARFDTTSVKNATIDADITVQGLHMIAGYTGTITQAATTTVNIGASDYDQSDGTFTDAGNATTNFNTDNGPFFLRGGTFSNTGATSTFTIDRNFQITGGTFTNTDTITFDGADAGDDSAIICSSTIPAIFTKTISSAGITISANCTIALGASPTSTLGVSDGIVNSGTITVASGTWTVNPSAANQASSAPLTNNGTITHSGSGWDINGAALTNSLGASITYAGTAITITRSFTQDGTFDLTGKTVTFDGSASNEDSTITCGATLQGNVTINKIVAGATAVLGSNCTVAGDFTRTDGIFTNPASAFTLTVQGNFSMSTTDTFGGANLTLTLGGGSNQNVTQNNSGTMSGVFKVDKSSNTATLTTAFTTGSTCNIAEGIFALASFDFTCASTFTVEDGGNLKLNGTQTVTAPTLNSGSTVTYTATSGTITVTTLIATYHHLVIDGSGGTFALGAALDVNGTLTLTAGTLDVTGGEYGITVGGGWTDTGAGAFSEGTTAIVTFDGTGTINSNEAFANVTIDASGLTVTLGAAMDVNGTLTLIAGTLDVSGSNYGITAQSWTDTGAGVFTEGAGTVTFDIAGGTINSNETFNNVTINHAGTTTLGANTAVASVLTITSGTLSASTYTITLSGTGTVFSNSGTYTAGTSTISITDTSSTNKTFAGGGGTYYILSITGAGTGAVILTGSNTFTDFTINAPKTVTFPASATQTISGTFTCTGTSGNVITINSSSSGTAATLSKSSGTVSCDYLSLQDSAATGGATWSPGTNSTDVSGNSGWGFNAAPSITAGPSDNGVFASPTNAGSDVTFTATATDSDADAYFLAICKTDAITAVNSAAPTCPGGSWGISSSTSSGSQASATYTTITGDSESSVWYAFVCDNDSSSLCSSSSQGGTGGNGSPFQVNHIPSFTAISNTSGSITTGNTVTFTSTASDSDTDTATDTVALYICRSNDFTGTACGPVGAWCNSSASASDPTCSYTIEQGDGDSAHTYYGYVIDNHSFASTSNPRSNTFTSDVIVSFGGGGGGGGGGSTASPIVASPVTAPVSVSPPVTAPVTQSPIEQITQIPPAFAKGYGEAKEKIIAEAKKITEQILEIQKQIAELISPKEEQPTQIVIVPKQTPLPLDGRWNLLPVQAIKRFVLSPLPKEIKMLAQKFPELKKTFQNVGITKITDVVKLEKANLKLPGLTQSLRLAEVEITPGKFTPPKGIPITRLSDIAKQKIPTEIIFAKTAGGLLDYNTLLSINNSGRTEQTIKTISGKPLQLVVKPDKLVKNVKGYIIFKSKKSVPTSFQIPLNYLTASLIFDGPNLTEVQEEPIINENKLVLLEFEYTDPDGDGIYTADINMPVVDGEYEIITVMDYEDEQIVSKRITLITIVDPEGYIYEKDGNKETRILGAVVSLYWLNSETKQYELWPSLDYQQENPQTTDVRGTYSFLVAEGYYYIKVDAPGYLSYDGKPFQVAEGSGVHINIEMKTKYWWTKIIDWKILLLVMIILLLIYNFYRDKIRERAMVVKNKI